MSVRNPETLQSSLKHALLQLPWFKIALPTALQEEKRSFAHNYKESHSPKEYEKDPQTPSLSLSLSLSLSSSSPIGYAASKMLRGRTPSPMVRWQRGGSHVHRNAKYTPRLPIFFSPSPSGACHLTHGKMVGWKNSLALVRGPR